MTTNSTDPTTIDLSTAWMPLDGLIQQWGVFGAERASTAPALHAVGMAICALARETTARSYYTAAWHTWQDADFTDLEHAVEELLSARGYWTDAMLSLELLLLDPYEEQASEDSVRSMLVEVMEQRGRVALLVHQTQQEQLAAYRGAGQPASNPHPTTTTGVHTAADCPIFGHDWQPTETQGERQCNACGTTGYCPWCTPHSPSETALPLFCWRHTTLIESRVQP